MRFFLYFCMLKMDNTNFIAYILCGAFLMLLVSGGGLLVTLQGNGSTAQRAKKRVCHLVGVIMLLFFVMVLINLIVSHTREQAGRTHLFIGFNILFLAIVTPLLFLVSYNIRNSRHPSQRRILLQYTSLLLPLAYYFIQERIVLLITLAYVTVYSMFVFVNHSLWFYWRKDMWLRYNHLYKKQSVWQMLLILVPIELNAILYVILLATPSLNAYYGYFVAGILLWGVAFYRTGFYNPCPTEEEECIADIEKLEALPEESGVQLSASLRNKISQSLQAAESEKLYLRQDVNLDTYAQYIGTNRTYVSRYLNQELNTTFCDYVNRLRLAYAKKLLAEQGKIRIADVASQCGYTDVTTFRRNFKKYEGCNPKELRQRENF